MKRNNKILTALLVLGLGLTTSDLVFGANSLVQMDIKKANPDTVDFTIYTSETAKDNVIVRKKSDNKYVVLIPGVSTSSISRPDFYSVKDVITNIDIKSVADTADGYTKMTVITKKPLNIRTKTVKSGPITAEQKEYRSLLAVANTSKNDNIKSDSKAEIIKPDVAPVPVKSVSDMVTPESINLKKLEMLSNSQALVTMPDVKSEKVSPVVDVSVSKTPKNVVPKKDESSLVKELQNDLIDEGADEDLSKNVPVFGEEMPVVSESKLSLRERWNNQIYPLISSKISAHPTLVMILIPLLALIFMIRLIKGSIEKSRDLRAAFVNKVKAEGSNITKKYTDITGDETLSWREKYQRYNEAVQNPEKYNKEKVERARQKYTFIKNATSVEDKRQNFEAMVSQSDEKSYGTVSSETDVIDLQMKRVRFKGFASRPNLRATSRENMRNSGDKIQEYFGGNVQPNVELDNSLLNQSVRRFDKANLDLVDVDERTKSLKDLKRMEELKQKDYEMSTLDEFFATPEDSLVESVQENPIKMISTPKKSTSETASENIKKLNSTMKMPRPYQATSGINLSKAFENPFNKKDGTIKMISTPKPQKSSVDEIKVSSSYEIDENHGFMVVSLDGKSALIGKSYDDITVLKEFDHIVEQPLQVRKDKENVYMVKTEGFKSLVEVSDAKMGVLIEL